MSHSWRPATAIAVLGLAWACAGGGWSQEPSARFDPLRDSLARNEPQPVYDSAPSHPWNRLFHLLFTRTFDVRLGPVAGEGMLFASDERKPGSTRTVTRTEDGDRAIDPLYPSWVWLGGIPQGSQAGSLWILSGARYPAVVGALEEVIATGPDAPVLPRALMQADLWAAFDLLSTEIPVLARTAPGGPETRRRTDHVLELLSSAIKALALTSSEVGSLPDTYGGARSTHQLPDLFDRESGWIEIRWFDGRMHERAVHDRRAARVFIKPAVQPSDLPAFLDRLRDGHGDRSSALDAVALLIQTLLIVDDGRVVPSPITYEVQVRRFEATRGRGAPVALQFELSRQRLLASPESGGLRALDEHAPAYLPSAGNDFSFATPAVRSRGPDAPVLVPLRQRCAACHGPNLDHLVTFGMTSVGDPPPVIALDARQHTQARDVAARKMKSESYAALRRYWTDRR